jgi:dipeptidyl aminopeptidase/acylaminoacyl peptidase
LRGWVDGDRVAILGGSAGGFSVLCGLANLESLATDTHKFESRYLDSLVAPLPEGCPVYQQRSPVLHMNRCRAAAAAGQRRGAVVRRPYLRPGPAAGG